MGKNLGKSFTTGDTEGTEMRKKQIIEKINELVEVVNQTADTVDELAPEVAADSNPRSAESPAVQSILDLLKETKQDFLGQLDTHVREGFLGRPSCSAIVRRCQYLHYGAQALSFVHEQALELVATQDDG